MVIPRHAHSANEAVELIRFGRIAAFRANRQLRLQQIHFLLAGMLAAQQPEQTHRQDVEQCSQSVEEVRGAEEIDAGKQVGGKEEQVEENEESQAVRSARLFYFVHYFGVADYLKFLAVVELIVEDSYELLLAACTGDFDGALFLVVFEVAIAAFEEHAFDNLLVCSLDGVHHGSPAVVVLSIPVEFVVGKTEQIVGDSDEARVSSFVQDGIADVIGTVRIEWDFPIPPFQQENYASQLIALYRHEQNIFILVAAGLHVSSISLEKLHHFDVAVQAGEVEGREPILVLDIDPGFELVFEGRVSAVVFEIFLGKGLEVQDEDLEFGEFVFEGCVVQQSGLVFLLEEGKVQLWPVLQVGTQVLVAFDVHDGVDGCARRRGLRLARHLSNQILFNRILLV